MRPLGSPPMPSARSRLSEPVETVSYFGKSPGSPPSAMMAPLPNLPTIASTALPIASRTPLRSSGFGLLAPLLVDGLAGATLGVEEDEVAGEELDMRARC